MGTGRHFLFCGNNFCLVGLEGTEWKERNGKSEEWKEWEMKRVGNREPRSTLEYYPGVPGTQLEQPDTLEVT